MKKSALLAAALLALGGLTTNVSAQEQRQRGNFNPDEMRARMMENLRTLLEVKNDDEWKLISARLEKVREARDKVRSFSGDFRILFNMGREGGGDQNRGGDQGRGGPGGGRGPGGFGGGTPNPDVEAFSKAVQTKAPTEELKQRMARVRDARKAAEAEYDKLADELRQVLTVRQEAALVAIGTLK
ncbi:MAG: hypothetical protein ACKODH_10360 [Limisphaerales bacterium]